MPKRPPNINNLRIAAQLALFTTSYSPLFLLIIAKKLFMNSEYLHWGGFSELALQTAADKFLLCIILCLFIIFGWVGFYQTFTNIERQATNGYPVKIVDVKNKNSESIGYIATYIIPFLQSFEGWFDIISVLFLLFIIFRIYVNSSLLLVNPLLSINYALYEIEYDEMSKIKNGLVISKEKFLADDEEIKLYEIGYKLYYVTL